jgi:hypothetical protein
MFIHSFWMVKKNSDDMDNWLSLFSAIYSKWIFEMWVWRQVDFVN